MTPSIGATTPTNQALRRARQVAVAGLVAAAVFVGAGREAVPIWLVPFIPFAGIGALLAIRRPLIPIGWRDTTPS